MENTKSLDNYIVIATLLQDVHTSCTGVFTPRSLRLTERKLKSRYDREGLSFLTKTLARLGKSLDRALLGEVSLDSTGFQKIPCSQLPKLFGELFERVFTLDGWVLPDPCIDSVRALRQLLFVYYKYEAPYDQTLANEVIEQFEKTDAMLPRLAPDVLSGEVIRKASALLERVLCNIDLRNITPRHGPGVVSTKETLGSKFVFSRYIARVAEVYPIDEYYYASLGHVVDSAAQGIPWVDSEPSARVCLVPKDSRGPRIISCEPLEIQWLQQGIMRVLVEHIESHPLTRGRVMFSDQMPNRLAALSGSKDGNTCTLDLKEASDRVSTELVARLFPDRVLPFLMATRSLSTQLPDGKVIYLRKFAPMGSALCFPVMALTIWSILVAGGLSNEQGDLLVYGDDVIVPTAQAANAITLLESVGLLINRQKSCTSGLFRESCGLDAFNGTEVTPVRFRTVWTHRPAASTYLSWLAYANSLWLRGYRQTALYIGSVLIQNYGSIPCVPVEGSSFPGFVFWHHENREPKSRWNSLLQRREILVLVPTPTVQTQEIPGWNRLLRYFTEGGGLAESPSYNYGGSQRRSKKSKPPTYEGGRAFSSGLYTLRRRSKLRKRWR